MNRIDNERRFFAQKIERAFRRPKKTPEARPYVPTLKQIDEVVTGLLKKSKKDTALRKRLLFFAGKKQDRGQKFSTHIDMAYGGWLNIIVNNKPSAIAARFGVGQSEKPRLYMENRGAVPDKLVFRSKLLSAITSEQMFRDTIESWLTTQIQDHELRDLSKRPALNARR